MVAITVGLAMLIALNPPVSAQSKSATIRVSCTILPVLEMTSKRVPTANVLGTLLPTRSDLEMTSQGLEVGASSNLGKNFLMTESLRQTETGAVKIYSLTAL